MTVASKVTLWTVALLVGLIIGTVLFFSALADMLELAPPLKVETKSDYRRTVKLEATDSSTSLWNGEHEALQPAQGYRAVQASEVPLQRTVNGQ